MHPLSSFPGPKFAASTKIPVAYISWTGELSHWLLALHERYDSDIVRISPDELSFISPAAWKDMFGSRQGGVNPFTKDMIGYGGIENIVTANDADHSRIRRLLSHAFSDKALREQEPLIKGYIDSLISGLRKRCEISNGIADLSDWFGWMTFDIIGDLAFGAPFDCLRETTYHPWVKMLMNNHRNIVMTGVAMRFPPFHKLVAKLIPKKVKQDRMDHYMMSKQRVDRRLDSETNRPDFISHIVRHNGSKGGMTREEIQVNAGVFIAAGSETTATLLCGALWSLLNNPAHLSRLQGEIRERFSSAEDITLQKTDDMAYLHAVISESLRMYPPGVAGQPRVSPPTGDYICGHYIPAKTGVQLNQYAAILERQAGRIATVFGGGAKLYWKEISLAKAEIALTLTRVLWEFDMTLSEETDKNWADQKAWFTWQQKPLMVILRAHAS
ncbi:MAG: hypothetical protein LQ345_006702 [Seirophora villosa]|nr:MAG: hypothetical protein LQ345_006702 [Seirophora villosa]